MNTCGKVQTLFKLHSSAIKPDKKIWKRVIASFQSSDV